MSRHALRARLDQVKPAWIVIAAWAIAIVYAYPGYMNEDATAQLSATRIPRITDWHPPVMTWYWHQFERLVRGPFPLLVLQTSLAFWGLFSILRRRFTPRSSAIVTSVVLLFPPVLGSIAHVGPDSQMAGFFLGGLAFALRPQWRWRALGVVLLVLAVAVRENGVAALLPFCVVVAGAWGIRRRMLVVAAAFGLCVALFLTATFVNSGIRDGRTYPWFRTIAIVDLAGMICIEGGTDEQIERTLRNIELTKTPGRDLHSKLCNAFEPRRSFEWLLPDERAVFDRSPERDDRLARKRVWTRYAKHHTSLFVAHRWSLMEKLLGISAIPEDPVAQTITSSFENPALAGTPVDAGPLRHRTSLSWLQKKLGGFFEQLAETPLYRPWIYAVLLLLLLVYAAIKGYELAAAFATSGLLYEATFFLAAPAPMFRYSLWMIACACIAAALILLERRHRAAP